MESQVFDIFMFFLKRSEGPFVLHCTLDCLVQILLFPVQVIKLFLEIFLVGAKRNKKKGERVTI